MIDFKSWRLLRECLECLLENQVLNEAVVEEIPTLLKNNEEEEFFRTIEPVVRRAIGEYLIQRGMSAHPEYLDDVVQKTLTNVFRNLRGDLGSPMRISHHREVIAFVRTIAINTLRDHLRSINRRPTTEIPEEIADRRNVDFATQELVKMALAKLPETFRQLLQWVYFDNWSYQEVAERLGVPVGTVKSRIGRAKQDLAKIIASFK